MASTVSVTFADHVVKSGRAYLQFTPEGAPYGFPILIAPDKATLEAYAAAILLAAKTAGTAVKAPTKREVARAAKEAAGAAGGAVSCACGAKFAVGGKFCPGCGQPRPASATCPDGHPALGGAKFCPVDGKPVTAGAPTSNGTVKSDELATV